MNKLDYAKIYKIQDKVLDIVFCSSTIFILPAGRVSADSTEKNVIPPIWTSLPIVQIYSA